MAMLHFYSQVEVWHLAGGSIGRPPDRTLLPDWRPDPDLDGRILAELGYLSPGFSNHFKHDPGDCASYHLSIRQTSLSAAWG